MSPLPSFLDLSEDQILVGPGRDPEEAVIDPIFGKDVDWILRDAAADEPELLAPVEGAPVTPSERAPGFSFQEVEGGVLLRDPEGDIAGLFLGRDLALDEDLRGRGLGAELVLERLLRFEDLPTWWHDEPAYSPAGAVAVRSAWRMAHDADLLARKLAPLEKDGAEPRPGPAF
jgi:hypothetical protein